MKLLLISPSHKFRKKLRAIKIPQLSLHILASLTPNDIDITVIDEEIREIDFSLNFDLVGISCMTATANRSYQLSDMFRQRGSKVVSEFYSFSSIVRHIPFLFRYSTKTH